MTYFETKGVEIQNNAYTAKWAIDKFADSCRRCCLQGKNIDCRVCHIASAHERALERCR